MDDESLSVEGEARKQSILLAAMDAASARRRKWWILRGGGLTLAGVLLLTFIILPSNPSRAPMQLSRVERPITPSIKQPPPPRGVVIVRIPTDMVLLERSLIRPSSTPVERLSDGALLAELKAAGKPAGLAYVDGRGLLLFQ